MIRVAVPKYDDFYGTLLKFLADGALHSVDECKNFVRDEMKLTDADLAELKSDGQLKWLAHVEWCLVTLEKSGLIRSQDAQIQITDAGRKLSGTNVTMKFLVELGTPALIEFIKNRRTAPKLSPPEIETPEEIFERVHGEINGTLSDELLKILSAQSASFFEKFTVKLMERMGYGLGEKTSSSDDGGQRQCAMRNVDVPISNSWSVLVKSGR